MNKKIIIGIIVLVIVSIFGYIFLSASGNSSKPVSKQDITENPSTSGYEGRVLAGKESPFIEFNTADYEKAKAENKIILLDFYATWCPVCRAEEPEINEGFNSLNTSNIVGFRVNYKDPDTDDSERALAQEFNIPYQHTKVILKNGVEVSRSFDSWKKEDFLSAINSALNK